MIISFKAKNIELTDELRNYIEKRLSYFEKFFKQSDQDAVLLAVEVEKMKPSQRKGELFRAEINLTVGGGLYRAEETTDDILKSVDFAKAQLSREWKKSKDRKGTLLMRGARSIRKAFSLSSFSRFRPSSKKIE